MRTVALEGQHPDNPDRYKGGTDRSAALYAVLGAAAVAGADEDILRSICFLPGPLGEHTREQTDPEKYVDRQVEKAVANLKADPDLERLNARHAVVADEGKVLVVNFERDTRGCQKLTWSSFSDFRNRYLNQWKLLGNRSVSLAKWWLTHPRRQQYEGVVFAPDKDVPGYLNYWHGFAVERQAGDWSLLRKHILENICCGDQELEAYSWAGWLWRCRNPANRAKSPSCCAAAAGLARVCWRESSVRFLAPTFCIFPTASGSPADLMRNSRVWGRRIPRRGVLCRRQARRGSI